MAKIKEKQEVLVVGYPNRVKAVADLLDMEGTGIYPVQVGVLSGNQEFLARLKLHSPPAAIILFSGPFKGILVPTVERVREIAPATLILAVLMEKGSCEDILKKAGVAAVLQHDGDIAADEVVEQLVEMLNNHGVSAGPCPVLRVPNAAQQPKVRMPRVKRPIPEVAPTLRTVVILPKSRKLVIARVSRMKRPIPEAAAITSRTFVVPESWRASAALAVASRKMARSK